MNNLDQILLHSVFFRNFIKQSHKHPLQLKKHFILYIIKLLINL